MASAKKETSLVNYGSYEMDAAREEKEDLDKSGGGAFFKFADGRNKVRFLPPPIGKRSPFVVTYQHYVQIPPGSDNGMSFNCPRMMAKRPCPICQLIDQMKGTGAKADFDIADKMKARARVYANIIERKAPEAGPQVVAFGKKIHEQLVALRENEDAGGDFTHPIEGFDIIVEKAGKMLNTTYKVMADRNSSKLGDMEWIDQQTDLDRFGIVQPYEEIAEKIREEGYEVGGGRQRAAAAAAPAGRSRGVRPQETRQAAPAARRGRNAEDDMVDTDDEDDDAKDE